MEYTNLFPKNCTHRLFLTKVIVSSVIFSLLSEMFYRIWRGFPSILALDNGKAQLNMILNLNWLHVPVFFVLGIILFYCLYRWGSIISDFIYRWRYPLSILIVVLLVAFDINGSSIHEMSDYVGYSHNGVLLGISRSARSDEWALNTPYAFAQASSGFPYFSDVIAAEKTDTFIVYGQPAWDFGVLFRPFQWGYLILGASRGLSFFWWSRLFALLLVSFEIGMLITKKNRSLSLALALMIGLSPFIQWWFAINGLVEMFISGFLAVLMIRKYMTTELYWQRILYALLIVECGCVYVLTFYPAWIVPIAYVMAGLALYVLITNWKNCKFNIKKDLPIIGMSIVLFIVCLGYVFLKSKDTIAVVMGSVYPGQRYFGNVQPISSCFQYLTNIFTAWIHPGSAASGNPVEWSSFICFFPLGLILSIYGMIRNKKADCLSIILLAESLFLGIICFIPLPEFIYTITLMKFSRANRVLPVLTLVQLLLLFRALYLIKDQLKWSVSVIISVILSLIMLFGVHRYSPAYFNMSMIIILAAVVFLFIITALLMTTYRNDFIRNSFLIIIALICFFSGVLVNPVQSGTRELTDTPTAKAVQKIVKEDPEAIWVAEGLFFPVSNCIIAQGGRTINSTNVYPHLERWKKLDPNGEYEDVYNRYAHIVVDLNPSVTSFELKAPDVFFVHLTPDDLVKLNVDYILTTRSMESYATDEITFTLSDTIICQMKDSETGAMKDAEMYIYHMDY